MSMGNGKVIDSEPPDSSKSERELLETIYDDMKAMKRELQAHRQDDMSCFAEVRETLTQIDARIELVRGQQDRLNRAVNEVTRDAREARLQANRVETAHDADIAARTGHAAALTTKLVNEAIDAKGDKRKVVAQVIITVLAILGAAAGGAASSQSLFGG